MYPLVFGLTISVTHIIQSGGLPLLAVVLFAEVGLFLGFFLPGDTLLITAGIYAKEGKINLAGVLVVAAIAASAGDSMAYLIGRLLGPKIFRNEDSVIFRPEHIKQAETFYEKYGAKTLLIAHFLPVIRTFTPLLAGVGRMPYKKFLTFDAIGDTAWAVIITLVGYYIGSRIPNVDHYILLVLAFVIVATVTPTAFQFTRIQLRKRSKKTAHTEPRHEPRSKSDKPTS